MIAIKQLKDKPVYLIDWMVIFNDFVTQSNWTEVSVS